jgi:uncharacterized Zn finger protein (UPF0148 family)
MRFSCPSCGKVLNVKDEYAGKKARCPGCQEGLTVPFAPEPEPEPEAAAAAAAPAPSASACPSCDGALPDGAVFCVACGYDLRSGKQLQTVTGGGEEEEDAAAAAEGPASGDAGEGYSQDERG